MRLPSSFSVAKRRVAAVNMIVSLASVVAIVGALNYLAVKHPLRGRWSQYYHFALSPSTKNILKGLTNQVDVIVYANQGDSTALHTSIDSLLKEYAYHSHRINVRYIDYVRNRPAARKVSQRYDLAGRNPSDLVIFSSGERHCIVTHQELRDYRISDRANALLQGQGKRVGFRGELLFTSALLNVTAGEAVSIAYIIGHGEHDLESEGLQGYAEFRKALEEKNFTVRPHHLINNRPLSQKTRLLIIAGPRRRFLQEEVEAVDRFLQTGGGLLILFNAHWTDSTGLERLLHRWCVQVGRNMVNDVAQRLGGDLVVSQLGNHPATIPLVNAKMGLLMSPPRSIEPLQRLAAERNLICQGIAYTSTNGVAQSDIPTFRRRGSIPVMASVEAKASEGSSPSGARLLVAGDSFFLSNGRIRQYGNRNFAALAAGWLTDQFHLIQGVGPQPMYEFKIAVPDREFRRLSLLMLAVFPGIVFALGIAVWLLRRRNGKITKA